MMSVLTTVPLVDQERRAMATTTRPTGFARLEKIAKRAAAVNRERDKEIASAFLSGASLREIADAVGLSHTGVKKIIDRTRVIGIKLDGPQKSMLLRDALKEDIFDIEIVYFTEGDE